MRKEVYVTPNAPRPTGPYSQALKVGAFLFIAGTLGVEPDTDELVEGGVAAQTRKAMENIRNVLRENGLDTKNIVKANLFIKNMDDFAVINEVYGSFFPDGKYPVRTCVEISRTPKNALIEIECTAVRLED